MIKIDKIISFMARLKFGYNYGAVFLRLSLYPFCNCFSFRLSNSLLDSFDFKLCDAFALTSD